MSDKKVSLIFVDERLNSQNHGQIFTHLECFQSIFKIQILQSFLAQSLIEMVILQILRRDQTIRKPLQRYIQEKEPRMAFIAIILKLIITQKSMRSKWNIVDSTPSQKEYIPIAQTQHIFLYPRHSRFSLLILNIIR